MKSIRLIVLSQLFLILAPLSASPDMTSNDRKLTTTTWLKNGIPLVIRETPGSDIAHFEVRFMSGSANQAPDRRAINLLTFELLPYSTVRFPKEKIFALTEKYSIGISCSGGVEISGCQVEAIQDYLPQALDLMISVITEPSFNQDDFDLAKKQRIASFQQESQSPEARVNSVVNTIFYDTNHPYRLLPEDGIKQVETLNPEAIRSYYRSLLDASSMFITYAGPKPTKATLDALEKSLGTLGKTQRQVKPVPAPQFDPTNTLAFEHRQIPTAYIRMKFNAPSAISPDAPAANVMFEILSEKLHEEVRTKRSLSYSVHANSLQYNQGIGVISATTSKPRETLETIASVVRDLRDKGVSLEELNEYRNTFTTSYYLTMETQDQLAGALAGSQAYFNDAMRLYEMPAKIDAVTPADIQRVAKETLKNFRIGVVYDRDKFMNEWVAPLK